MPKTSIKDWLWSQHAPPEVMASFEKLFALPEKWHKRAGELALNGQAEASRIAFADAEELLAILEGKD